MPDPEDPSAEYRTLPEPVRLDETVTTQPIAESPDGSQSWAQHNRFLHTGGGPEGADGDGD